MLSAITVSARSNYNLPCVSESEMLQGNVSPSVSPSLVHGWLKMKEGPPLASTKVSSRPMDIWNKKQQASVTSTAWRWQNSSRFHYLCSARCWINASLYFCSKGIPLDSPSVSRNGKCVQFYTSRSGGHFERTPSFAAFLALYFLTPNYVSGRTHCQQLQITGCLILLLRAAVRPHAQPSTATDGPDRCMSLANVPLLLREGRKNST